MRWKLVRAVTASTMPHRRSKSERSASAYPALDDVVVPMDALGDTYFRLANHDRVGRAVRVSAQCATLSSLQLVHAESALSLKQF